MCCPLAAAYTGRSIALRRGHQRNNRRRTSHLTVDADGLAFLAIFDQPEKLGARGVDVLAHRM